MLLRRASTGLHLHRHRPLSQHHQNAPGRCPFSSTTSLHALSERKTPNSSPSSSPSSSIPEVEKVDASGSARASAPNKGAATHIGRSLKRSLRPILIPPSFPSSKLLPVMPIPHTPPSSHENAETDLSSTTTTITITGLPPNTLKTDIRPVFHRFGEVTRIYLQSDGRGAEVVFADAHAVKRTLHAYAERPLCVRGNEIVVFRKRPEKNEEVTDTSPRETPAAIRTRQVREGGAIFVAGFPPGMAQEELLEAMAQFGNYDKFVMCQGSKSAYFVYSNEDIVKEILHVHQRVPITVRGITLRVELTENPRYANYSMSRSPLEDASELGKPLDPATSAAIIRELNRTLTGFNATFEPTRVIWVAGLPFRISRAALAKFWSRLGCVVDVRTNMLGFAYVEFASAEDASRALRQGVPHGFRYRERLLNVDFAPLEFYVGPVYHSVYISKWPASGGRFELLRWTDDIPNIAGVTILPPFRGEKMSDPRSAFLRFVGTDNARKALRMLNGRRGPGGEALDMRLSRRPMVHANEMWQWIHKVEKEGGERCLEDDWEGLGFGTGEEVLPS